MTWMSLVRRVAHHRFERAEADDVSVEPVEDVLVGALVDLHLADGAQVGQPREDTAVAALLADFRRVLEEFLDTVVVFGLVLGCGFGHRLLEELVTNFLEDDLLVLVQFRLDGVVLHVLAQVAVDVAVDGPPTG